MAPIVAALAKAASNIALSFITRLLTEKYLKRFIEELLISALKKYAARTQSVEDDKLIKIIEDAFRESGNEPRS